MLQTVGKCRLRYLLDERNMTQTELALRIKSTPQQIQHYIANNRIMSLNTAKNISLVLGCSIDDLYEWLEVGNKK